MTPIQKALDALHAAAFVHHSASDQLGDQVREAIASLEAPPLTDERILHLWDTHVGEPSNKYPFTNVDKIHVARALLAVQPEQAKPVEALPEGEYTYASKQATHCAGCSKYKHTPLRIDAMGGYVCWTCIDQKLGSLLGEFGYPGVAAQPLQARPVAFGKTVEHIAAWFDARANVKYSGRFIASEIRRALREDAEAAPAPQEAPTDAQMLDWLEQAYTNGAVRPRAWRAFMTRVAESGFRSAIRAAMKESGNA